MDRGDWGGPQDAVDRRAEPVTATEEFDVVVVGSGFGGSVSAFRLAEAGLRVCVLERGKPYPPGSFARTPADVSRAFWDPSKGLQGLFDIWSFEGIEGVVSSGLGGGSLIYANVLLRKPEKYFVTHQPFTGGYEEWPITRADLDPHYDAAEKMLNAQLFPEDAPGFGIPKTAAMRAAAQTIGREFELTPLAVTFANEGEPPMQAQPIPDPYYGNIYGLPRTTCRLSGECDMGCNYGSKNTLDHNYLSAAKYHGADIRTRSEVRALEPSDGGRYLVTYVEHTEENEGRPTNTRKLPRRLVSAKRVVLAAGTFGSPYLLLRNRSAFKDLSPALGSRFCGNGDLLGFMLDARGELDPSNGPVITSATKVPDELEGGPKGQRGFIIEDAGYPQFVNWLVEGATVGSNLKRMLRFALNRIMARLGRDPRSDISADVSALIGDGRMSSHALPLLGMGRDVPDGQMSLRDGWLEIDWTTKTSQSYFDSAQDTMKAISAALGADFHPNPLGLLHRVITVHPLGGCPMGNDPRQGVVDGYGEVFGYPGLFVLDGSAMPGPVGVNPSLTIAAFADRAADHILSTGGAAS